MQKLILRNFGPITEIELDINDIMIFIGPQASGKSTISKTIYFFKSLKDDLLKYFIESLEHNDFEKPLSSFSKKIRGKFLDFWGSTLHLSDIYLEYFYGNEVSIRIELKEGYAYITYSRKFLEQFNLILSDARKVNDKLRKRDLRFMSSGEMLAAESVKRVLFTNIEKLIQELFFDTRDLVFIPAGRSLLATLSDQLQLIHPHRLDYLMRAFVDRIINSKPLFSKSLNELVTDRKKYSKEVINFEFVYFAQRLIENIMKASYIVDSEGEKLFYSEDKYVKIKHASSGQQEVIWILLLIFLIILENRQVFIVIEEPEAHLYPEAQKLIIDLIALLANVLDNQVIITTHSPYILSSFNNLLYAFRIGQHKSKEIKDIVDKKLWINPNRIDSFFVLKGHITEIIDKEYGMIETEYIDGASEIINNIFNKIVKWDN
jgi:predicted ATP-dependent endonuclease of OLD family